MQKHSEKIFSQFAFTGQTFAINWSKIQLSWVMMLYYPYKTMFSAYKSVLCICLQAKWRKSLGTWMSIFGGHFSVCDDCILKSTRAWLLKLSVLYIHSFIQVNNTNFQIKTVFNNVLFSTEVHNPLHAHLLALSHTAVFYFSTMNRSMITQHYKYYIFA